MMNIKTYLYMAVLALAATACSSSDEEVMTPEQPIVNSGDVTLTAIIPSKTDGAATTRLVTDAGNTLTVIPLQCRGKSMMRLLLSLP